VHFTSSASGLREGPEEHLQQAVHVTSASDLREGPEEHLQQAVHAAEAERRPERLYRNPDPAAAGPARGDESTLSLQTRLEGTPAGRAVISVFLGFTVLAILVVNMPSSVLKSDLARVTDPFVQATGLDQNWAIFSQPRDVSAYVEARVDFADGSSRVVPIPASGGLGNLVDYRWQKYEEMIRPDSGRPYWADYARYVAAQVRTREHVPVRVDLVRRYAATRPPGPGPVRDPWAESTFFVYDLRAEP
jgi:hypothetical protein